MSGTAGPAGGEPRTTGEGGASVADLVALVDRLEALLERSALVELEVEADGTMLILRRPEAVAASIVPVSGTLPPPPVAPLLERTRPAAGEPGAAPGHHAVAAPLTGVYYGSPAPGAARYVVEGGQVSAGQVIGLIEAMKLFNEIKSDVTGTVRRIAVEDGALVKAKQTLIEVEPT